MIAPIDTNERFVAFIIVDDKDSSWAYSFKQTDFSKSMRESAGYRLALYAVGMIVLMIFAGIYGEWYSFTAAISLFCGMLIGASSIIKSLDGLIHKSFKVAEDERRFEKLYGSK